MPLVPTTLGKQPPLLTHSIATICYRADGVFANSLLNNLGIPTDKQEAVNRSELPPQKSLIVHKEVEKEGVHK